MVLLDQDVDVDVESVNVDNMNHIFWENYLSCMNNT